MKTTQVHNAWIIYGLDEHGSELNPPIATLSRPQDWGDPAWHYEQFQFKWKDTDDHIFINNCHCWTDLKLPKHKYPELFVPLIVQILMPGSDEKLCDKSHLAEEDFWDESWGEAPPYFVDLFLDLEE